MQYAMVGLIAVVTVAIVALLVMAWLKRSLNALKQELAPELIGVADRANSDPSIADLLVHFDEVALIAGAQPALVYCQSGFLNMVLHVSITSDPRVMLLGVIGGAELEFEAANTPRTSPPLQAESVRASGQPAMYWSEVSSPFRTEDGSLETLITSASPIAALASELTEILPEETAPADLLARHAQRLEEASEQSNHRFEEIPADTEELWVFFVGLWREVVSKMTGRDPLGDS